MKDDRVEFDIVVKGVRYVLREYKALRNEWDLIVGDDMVCDSKPKDQCIEVFLLMIKD